MKDTDTIIAALAEYAYDTEDSKQEVRYYERAVAESRAELAAIEAELARNIEYLSEATSEVAERTDYTANLADLAAVSIGTKDLHEAFGNMSDAMWAMPIGYGYLTR